MKMLSSSSSKRLMEVPPIFSTGCIVSTSRRGGELSSLGRLRSQSQAIPARGGNAFGSSEILLWPDLQGGEVLTLGDEVGAWCESAERRLCSIIHMVVDVEQIAAGTWRDIAV